jgi:hypothetical protein
MTDGPNYREVSVVITLEVGQHGSIKCVVFLSYALSGQPQSEPARRVAKLSKRIAFRIDLWETLSNFTQISCAPLKIEKQE